MPSKTDVELYVREHYPPEQAERLLLALNRYAHELLAEDSHDEKQRS